MTQFHRLVKTFSSFIGVENPHEQTKLQNQYKRFGMSVPINTLKKISIQCFLFFFFHQKKPDKYTQVHKKQSNVIKSEKNDTFTRWKLSYFKFFLSNITIKN
jgi:hypothetical protein